jgi:multiple sugar transport system substrate-binding protein
MCPNWHEFAASNETSLPGKVDYAPLPRGPARSSDHYGGCLIGIADNATGAVRGAAWLFVNWATSTEAQLSNLKSKAGRGTPTRTSVYDRAEVKEAEQRPHGAAEHADRSRAASTSPPTSKVPEPSRSRFRLTFPVR